MYKIDFVLILKNNITFPLNNYLYYYFLNNLISLTKYSDYFGRLKINVFV